MTAIFKPIVNAIGCLENESSNVGDIWPQFILVTKQIKLEICETATLRTFKDHTLKIIGQILIMGIVLKKIKIKFILSLFIFFSLYCWIFSMPKISQSRYFS